MSPDNWQHMIIFSWEIFWLPLYFLRHFDDLRDKQLNWPEYAGLATSCGGLVLTKLRRTHKLAEGHFISTATFFMVTNAHTLISRTYLKLFRFVPKKLITISKTTTIAGDTFIQSIFNKVVSEYFYCSIWFKACHIFSPRVTQGLMESEPENLNIQKV